MSKLAERNAPLFLFKNSSDATQQMRSTTGAPAVDLCFSKILLRALKRAVAVFHIHLIEQGVEGHRAIIGDRFKGDTADLRTAVIKDG